jgi:hypothetical protein
MLHVILHKGALRRVVTPLSSHAVEQAVAPDVLVNQGGRCVQ